MKYILYSFFILCSLFAACKSEDDADAMGSFEADEVIVSSEVNGTILSLNFDEGDQLQAGSTVGKIDDKSTQLQKSQVQAMISSLNDKTQDVGPQVKLLQDQMAVQQAQLQNAKKDLARLQNLKSENAATQKQVDDASTMVDVLNKQIIATRQQIQVTQSNVSTQNRSVLSEADPLNKQINLIDDQMNKSNIINPINGTVITRYALQGEFTTIGKPIYKIANLDELYLKAYVDQTQLSQIRLGQNVKVRIDQKEGYKYYNGVITWINDEAEFTPKTIQTKDERENLVYAIKIRVPNDGGIKLGMYGEALFSNPDQEDDSK